MPTKVRSSPYRRALVIALLGLGVCGLFSACSMTAYPPTYSEAELKAQCERHGGWWRGNLIPGYCEYQLASQSP